MQQSSPGDRIESIAGNTSGQGLSAIVPPEIEGWNWGAFLLSWVWGVGNKVWWALLALIPVPFLGLAIAILLGLKGNEWAWKFKKWESVERFRRSQRIWMWWGIASLLAPLGLLIAIILMALGVLGYYGYIKF